MGSPDIQGGERRAGTGRGGEEGGEAGRLGEASLAGTGRGGGGAGGGEGAAGRERARTDGRWGRRAGPEMGRNRDPAARAM